MVRLTIHLSHSIARRLIDRACPWEMSLRSTRMAVSFAAWRHQILRSRGILRIASTRSIKPNSQYGLVAAVRREMHQCPLRGEAVKFLVPRNKLQALCSQQCPHKTPPTLCPNTQTWNTVFNTAIQP